MGWSKQAMVCPVEGKEYAYDPTPDASCSKSSVSKPRASTQGLTCIFDLFGSDVAEHLKVHMEFYMLSFEIFAI